MTRGRGEAAPAERPQTPDDVAVASQRRAAAGAQPDDAIRGRHWRWREDVERQGWKRPRGEREAPHPFFVEYDRHRVICRECPWFWERVGAAFLDLKAMGQRHRENMRGAERS